MTKSANTVFSGFGTTVFEVMTQLANRFDAVNLGQGFPDSGAPADVVQAAAEAVLHGPNQYPPMMGLPQLRRAVAAHDARFYGIEAAWETEVLVTSGATEALAASLLGLVDPGDEVVVFEPSYDSYVPMIRRAGGIPKFVTLKPPDWRFTAADLDAAFSDRTKAVLLNNPLNPAAKVFDANELEMIAARVVAADAYAICDEVYEHIVFDGAPHVPLITLPGMRKRCLKIGSAGKTFSLTGWKVGYVTAAPGVLAAVMKAHQFLVFTTPPNLQTAVAFGLAKDDAYFSGLGATMQSKRDLLADGLARAGYACLPCAGTYFLNVDLAASGIGQADDVFCRRLIETARVAALPVSAFYPHAPNAEVSNVIRFCFAKKEEVLSEALARLEEAGPALRAV